MLRFDTPESLAAALAAVMKDATPQDVVMETLRQLAVMTQAQRRVILDAVKE